MDQLEVSAENLVAKATSAIDEITAFANQEINRLRSRIAELEKQVDYLYPFKESYSVLKEVSVAQTEVFAEILSKSNASLAELQDQIVEVKKQRDTLLAAYKQTSSIGRFCLSEDDCIVAGIDFSAYERGLSDAIEAFRKLFSAAIASMEGSTE